MTYRMLDGLRVTQFHHQIQMMQTWQQQLLNDLPRAGARFAQDPLTFCQLLCGDGFAGQWMRGCTEQQHFILPPQLTFQFHAMAGAFDKADIHIEIGDCLGDISTVSNP